jgi:hypothetical protein
MSENVEALALLGGARRVRTRVRGFAPWSPQAATLQLLDQVRGVLDEYEDYLPLTIRRIFYRLVGAHNYEKTEQAYDRLCEHLNRARRARLISFDVIRDDGGVIAAPDDWRSVAQFWATVRGMAEEFTLDHSAGQKVRLVVICEAAGMVPQLARVANPFGVTIMSGGGFDSVTDKHKFAAALAGQGRLTIVLHIGDTTTRQGSRCSSPTLRTSRPSPAISAAMCALPVWAVIPEQIARHRLQTAPPKKDDNRAFHGETCQAEALAPDVLAGILRAGIEQHVDQRVLDRVLRQERGANCWSNCHEPKRARHRGRLERPARILS